MSITKEVEVRFKASSEDKALMDFLSKMKGAQVAITGAGKSGKQASEGIGILGDKIKQFVGYLGGILAVGKAFTFLKESVTAALEGKRAIVQLEQGVQNLAGATQEQAKATVEWMEEVDRASGIAKEKLVPAFLELVGASKDVTGSQRLMELAIGASKAGLGDVESITMKLSMAMMGLDLRGQDTLTIILRNAKANGTLKETINDLYKKYGDLGRALDDDQLKMEQSQQAWANSKEAIGNVIAVIVTKGLPAWQALSQGLGMVIGGFLKLVGATGAVTIGMAASAKAALQASRGDIQGALGTIKQGLSLAKAEYEKYSDRATEVLTEITQAWDMHVMAGTVGTKVAEKQMADIIRKMIEKRKTEEQLAKEREAEEQRLADFTLHAENQIVIGIEETADEIMDILDKARKSREANEKSITQTIADELRKRYQLEQDALRKEQKLQNLERMIYRRTELQELKDKRKEISEELKYARAGTEEEIRLRMMLAEVDRQVTEIQVANKQALLTSSFAAADQFFNITKGSALQAALINAFLAGAGAAADTPGDVYTRIAAFALAFAKAFTAYVGIQGINWSAGGGGGGGGAPTVSAAGGYDIPSGMNPIAQLHAREMVLPARYAEVVRFIGERFQGQSITTQNYDHSRSTGPKILVNQHLLSGADGRRAADAAWRKIRPAMIRYERVRSGGRTTRQGSKRWR